MLVVYDGGELACFRDLEGPLCTVHAALCLVCVVCLFVWECVVFLKKRLTFPLSTEECTWMEGGGRGDQTYFQGSHGHDGNIILKSSIWKLLSRPRKVISIRKRLDVKVMQLGFLAKFVYVNREMYETLSRALHLQLQGRDDFRIVKEFCTQHQCSR